MAYQKQTYQDGITEYTDTLFKHMDDGIFGAYPVQLIAISDTAPSQCVENDKYYNTSTKKIYTATGTNTWGSTGTTPLEDTSYWLISENGNYAWDGTDLVSIGGGKAEVVISDEEPDEGKIWVNPEEEIPVIAGREHLVQVSNEVDEDYRVNLIKGNNLFKGFLFMGIINEGGDYSGVNTRITNANSTTMKTFILKQGTYTVDVPGLDYCAVITKNESGTRIDDFADSWKALPFTFTTTQDAYIYISARKSDNSVLNPNDYSFILQEGSTIKPIQYNQIVVDDEKYTDTLNVGQFDSRSRVNVLKSKNLLPKMGTKTIAGLTATEQSDGSLILNGTVANSNFSYYYCGDDTNYQHFNALENGGTFTLSCNAVTGYYIYVMSGGSVIASLTNGGSTTFTVQAGQTYRIFIRVSIGTTLNNVHIYPMLNEGSEELEYEPYITPSIYVDNEEIYSKPVVLWQNSSPASDMANNASLNLNTNDYNSYEVLWVMSTSDNSNVFSSGRIPKGKSTILNTTRCASGGTTNYERPINYNSDTLLKSGIPYSATASARSATASVLIPYMILGWK